MCRHDNGSLQKLTSVDISHVLVSSCPRVLTSSVPPGSGRRVTIEVLKEHPELEIEPVLVDGVAMQLIHSPTDFDGMVSEICPV